MARAPIETSKTNQSRNLAWRVISLLRGQAGVLVGLGAMVVCSVCLDIAVPFLTQRIIDGVLHAIQTRQTHSMRVLLVSAAGILVATALTRLLRSVYNYKLFQTASQAEDEIKSAAFAGFLYQDTEYHAGANTGEVAGSLDRGGTAIFIVLYEVLGQNLIPSLLVFGGVFAALLARNTWIAIAVFLPVPVYIAIVSRLNRRMHQFEQDVTESFEAVSKEQYDVASNAAVVKKFSRERDEAAVQRELLSRARTAQFRAERLWAIFENSQTCIATLGRVVVIALGGYLVLNGRCTIGDYVLFICLQDMVYQPASQLSVILPKLRRNLSRVERLFEILDRRREVRDVEDAPALAPLRHSVEFQNVCFRYADSERWALNNISFKVPAGATVALIGRSGTGKTTLVNLLQRCFDPQRGRILVDGVDIRDVAQESLRRQLAVVPQEVDLFSRSILENIAYGCPSAAQREVEEAARMAQAHGFIERCESGYDAQVGQRGLKLSGGERQRLGIARAILRNPKILILDEATSHLDTESERLIQHATEQMMKGRTCFVIAHRLSTVRKADLVVVFAEEGIEAVGTHDDLWKTSLTYRKLHGVHSGAPIFQGEVFRPAPALVN